MRIEVIALASFVDAYSIVTVVIILSERVSSRIA